MFADSLRFQHFFLIIFCKFFGFFARLFAFFGYWASGRTGSRPEPDPTLARHWPEPDPNTEQLLPVLITAGTADVNLVSRRYWLEGLHYLHPEQLFEKVPTRRPQDAWVSWAAWRKANNYSVTALLQVWALDPARYKANNYYQFWRLQVRPRAGVANNYSVS